MCRLQAAAPPGSPSSVSLVPLDPPVDPLDPPVDSIQCIICPNRKWPNTLTNAIRKKTVFVGFVFLGEIYLFRHTLKNGHILVPDPKCIDVLVLHPAYIYIYIYIQFQLGELERELGGTKERRWENQVGPRPGACT